MDLLECHRQDHRVNAQSMKDARAAKSPAVSGVRIRVTIYTVCTANSKI